MNIPPNLAEAIKYTINTNRQGYTYIHIRHRNTIHMRYNTPIGKITLTITNHYDENGIKHEHKFIANMTHENSTPLLWKELTQITKNTHMEAITS